MRQHLKTNIKHLNLHLCKPGCWEQNELPIIKPNDIIPPPRLVSFKDCKRSKDYQAGVHFFIDDVYFESVWKCPERYISLLSKFACVILPDFSVYYDVAVPVQRWNLYRSRLLGMYWQSKGIKVIPTFPFAGYQFNCYAAIGLPKEITVAVSTIGSQKNPNRVKSFQDGLDLLWKHLHPKQIIVYGDHVKFNFHQMRVYSYEQFRISAGKSIK